MSDSLPLLARALHVLAVVIWIGGVGFVTAVVLPAVRAIPDVQRQIALFECLERRFSLIARLAILVAGVTGFYMVSAFDLWDRFLSPEYWWMHAMLIVWLFFAAMLFVAEPFVLRRRFASQMDKSPEATLAFMHIAHWVLLVLSLITIAGAVAGAHGLRWDL